MKSSTPTPPRTTERDAMRATVLGRLPSWYNPWFHLIAPSLVGIGLLVAALFRIHGLRAIELLAVPVAYVLLNAAEWRVHRNVLHRRTPGATLLYERHTPEHHRIYVTRDMAMRDRREFALVLVPAYGIVLAFASTLPPAALLFLVGLRNVACLFVATTMGYVVSYEWLHLAYHAPPKSWIGRIGLIRRLRGHHAVHHDPVLMQRWNMNVTVPLWDWVRGTIYRKTGAR